MDGLLYDELLHEIIQRLPPSSFAAVSLVSKRWLSALHFCLTGISITFAYPDPPFSSQHYPPLLPLPSPWFSDILSRFPNLSTLAILPSRFGKLYPSQPRPLLLPSSTSPSVISFTSDAFLLSVAASPCASRLFELRFGHTAFPLSSSALISSSTSLTNLTDLYISSAFPFSFRWLSNFPNIKFLCFIFSRESPASLGPVDAEDEESVDLAEEEDKNSSIVMLPLESLSLTGVRAGDRAMSWVWRRCGNLRWLQLRECEGTGDGPSSPSSFLCLPRLLELELRSCPVIADRVLLAADHCRSLTSLLLHDGLYDYGCSRDALHHFILRRAASLHTIDLQLCLVLTNDHLSAIASASVGESNSSRLSTLRLQGSDHVSGHGLRALANAAAGKAIEELALMKC